MKVKRLKAEKASRAKERWLKAESATAGQKKMGKRRQAAAIKIQASPLGMVLEGGMTCTGQHLPGNS